MQRLNLYLLTKKLQSARQKQSRAARQISASAAKVILSIVSIALCGFFIAAAFFYANLTSSLPPIEQLPVLLDRQNGELLQSTRLLDRTGTQELVRLDNPGAERRFLTVNPEEADHFSLQLLRVVVAELDPTFWTNSGIDTKNLLDPQPNTIAERLVKDLLLADEADSTRSALRMRLLASQLVSHYGRTQVLEWYLNNASFGHLSFGAESAAKLYLDKSASDLDLTEAALLVALIESPALNPLDAPVAAVENQQKVLKDLSDRAVITPEEYTTAINDKSHFATAPADTNIVDAGFMQLAEKQLRDLLGENRVNRGGLVVTTTLDLTLQDQLLCASRSQLLQIEVADYSGVASEGNDCPAANYLPTQNYSWEGNADLLTASLVMDPQTGQILAYTRPISLTGSTTEPSYQPGSLLSPFVALAAFARGTSPASLAWDVPSTLPASLSDQVNPDGLFHGAVNIRSALANDYLTPIAGLFDQIDALTIWSLAATTGLTSPQQQSATAAALFGTTETSMLEIGQAYSTLASSGMKTGLYNPQTGDIEPTIILNVQTSTGQMLVDNSQPQKSAALSTSLAYLINNVLSDETVRWPSLGHPNVLEVGRTAAAKIGQISSKDQVWTVGYTPNRLVLTWFGANSDQTPTTELDPRMPAGLWHALIQYTSQDQPDEGWTRPADVSEIQVCSPSGMLPTSTCPSITTDVFINGNEPTQTDTLYQKIKVNRETGLLATVFTPAELVEERIFINVPASVREWASGTDLEIPPLGYDAIPSTQTNPLVQISSPALFTPVSGKVTITGTANSETFASYNVQIGQGINPDSWQQVDQADTQPVENGQLALWDTTGLNGLYAIRLNVVQQDNQIQTTVIQVTVDNIPPTVRITSPIAEAQVKPVNGVVMLSAEVTDRVGLSRVEWWIDSKKIGERSEAPFTYLWSATRGKHNLLIKAWDTSGNETESTKITFTVIP